MKTVLYLIQTAKGMPEIYECLQSKSNHRDYLLLSFKEKTSDTTIYAPNTTWTQGRNLLYHYVRDNNIHYDYYVFLDDDLLFQKSGFLNAWTNEKLIEVMLNEIYKGKGISWMHQTQAAGFASLEATFETGEHPIVTMRCWNFNAKRKEKHQQAMQMLPQEIRKKGVENTDWILQSVDWFDPCCNAISKRVFFADTILPYSETYDSESWWISGIILVIKAQHYYPEQMIQNNQYMISNSCHTDYPRGISWTNIVNKEYKNLCKEYGIDKIQFSKGIEIKPKKPMPIDYEVGQTRRNKIYYVYKVILVIFTQLRCHYGYKILRSIVCGLCKSPRIGNLLNYEKSK